MTDFRSIRAKPSGVGQVSPNGLQNRGIKQAKRKKVFEMFKVRWWYMKHETDSTDKTGWSLGVLRLLALEFILAIQVSGTRWQRYSGIKDCLICRDALKFIHSFIHSTSIY